jgi:hypothetical protein
MKKQKYPVEADSEKHLYEFFSEGPMGRIRKVILYEKIGDNFFNLGFGDWDEELQQADDSSRSNNGDRDKALATVAFTALDFTSQFPSARIVAQGSTAARTRLYQMGIADNLLEIWFSEGYQTRQERQIAFILFAPNYRPFHFFHRLKLSIVILVSIDGAVTRFRLFLKWIKLSTARAILSASMLSGCLFDRSAKTITGRYNVSWIDVISSRTIGMADKDGEYGVL